MTDLVARAAGFEEDEDDEVLEAGFAEEANGSGFALLIQRTDYEPDEQEVSLGMDTYCLTTGSGRTHYGGLRSVSRKGKVVELSLTGLASDVLGVPETFIVELNVPDEDADRFFSGLPRVVLWGREEERPVLSGFDS